MFGKPISYKNEEDGTINHIARIVQSDKWIREGKVIEPKGNSKYYSARVVVLADSMDEVKTVQSRLPTVFHEFDPVELETLIQKDERAEPQRLIYLPTSFYEANKSRLELVFVMPYSCIIKNDGKWTDVRDITSCKWGRWIYTTDENTILSHRVLNGEIVL